MMTVRGKRMREPRDIQDIKEATGFSPQDLKRNLGSMASPFKAVSFLDREVLHGSDGTGFHFWFPLTRMKYIGEFLSGALSEIAPNARATMLVTPAASEMTQNMQALRSNIERAKSPDDEYNVLFDNFVNHTTPGPLTRAFGGNLRLIDTRKMGAGFLEKFSHIDKDREGGFAMGSGYLLDYLLKHPEIDPHEKFRNVGYILEEKILHNSGEYFTEDELDQLSVLSGKKMHSLYDFPREGRKKAFIDFIRGLDSGRKKTIIRKMNKEDAQKSRAVYLYGKALAKDYLRKTPK